MKRADVILLLHVLQIAAFWGKIIYTAKRHVYIIFSVPVANTFFQSFHVQKNKVILPFSPGGGGRISKRWGCAARAPWSTWREREIKKCMVTKRELLNNLSNIYKCKVSPGGTFSLGNFLFDERENYQV